MFTENWTWPRSKKSASSRAASTATLTWASSVEAPRWGVTSTAGCLTSGWSAGGGSGSKTSIAAPATLPAFSASSSAASSIRPPRAQLMIRTPGFIRGERRGADDVAGLGGHRRVQGDEVAARPEVVELLDALDAELQRLVGGEERVEADDGHAERLRPLRHRQADPAEPDDAERLALELRAGELVAVPPAGLEAVVRRGDVARQGQHQGHGVLGRRDRVAAGRVHHDDPAPGRRRHVDVVDADARPHDRLEPRLALEDLGRQLRARPDHDPVGLAPAPCAGPARPWRAWC